MMFRPFLFLYFLCWGFNCLATGLPSTELLFTENKGQISDQYNSPRTDINFKVNLGDGLIAFIGAGFIQYQYVNKQSRAYQTANLLFCLEGADKYCKGIAAEPQPYTEYIYDVHPEPLQINSYAKIEYKNIYPGIDWLLYFNKPSKAGQQYLEYDFIVHEGADPAIIKMVCHGARHIGKSASGALLFQNKLGRLIENKPYAYELKSGKEVAINYTLKHKRAGFNTAAYKGTLVIDPLMDWSTYYGGSSDETANGLCADNQGNIYFCGRTSSLSNIATVGSFQASIGGASDAFIVCMNSLGQRQWATYFGGPGDDWANAIVYNNAGGIYVAGSSNSSIGMSTTGSHQSTCGGGIDGFLAKFNTAGARLWSTYFGGNDEDQATALACRGPVLYLAGYTKSTNGIAAGNYYQDTLAGDYDGFLARFSPTGSLLWAKYVGGTALDQITGLSCDTNLKVYATGITLSTGLADSNAYQDSLAGSADAFLMRFDSLGARSWSTYFGGPGSDNGYSIFCDTSLNLYLSGSTNSTSGIASTNPFQASLAGGFDAFLAKFNSSGSFKWATYYGGTANDCAYSVCSNGTNKVFLGGSTGSNSGIASSGAYQNTFGGGSSDAFVGVFDSTGQRTWASYLGGSGSDSSKAVALDLAQNIYTCGVTASNAAISTANSFQQYFGGGTFDAFVAKFKLDTIVAINLPFYDTVICAGAFFQLSVNTVSNFLAANVFTVQLSDSSGNFSNAVNLGALVASGACTIGCTIPANTLAGQHYRIRVYATMPSDTSQNDGADIRIKPLPFHSIASNSPLCTGDTLHLRDSAANLLSAYWHGPNSMSSYLINPYMVNIIPSDSGWYFVKDSFSNSCVIRDSVFVQIGITPHKPLASSNNPACLNDSLLLSATDSTPNVSYSWLGPNSFTSSLNPILQLHATYADSGWYVVNAHLAWCSSPSDSIWLSVDSFKSPSVTLTAQQWPLNAGQTDTFRATAFNCPHIVYSWYLNGSLIAGWDSSYFVTALSSTDTLRVLVHCIGPCLLSDSAGSTPLTPLAVKQFLTKSSILIYPNPANDVLHVDGNSAAHIKIYTFGALLALDVYNSNSLNISMLPAGTYRALIFDANENLLTSQTFVKLH